MFPLSVEQHKYALSSPEPEIRFRPNQRHCRQHHRDHNARGHRCCTLGIGCETLANADRECAHRASNRIPRKYLNNNLGVNPKTRAFKLPFEMRYPERTSRWLTTFEDLLPINIINCTKKNPASCWEMYNQIKKTEVRSS